MKLKIKMINTQTQQMKYGTATKNLKETRYDVDKMNTITGRRVGGDRMCNSNEIESSTKDLIDKCLEIDGGIVLYQDLKVSTFSINTVRYLNMYGIQISKKKLKNNFQDLLQDLTGLQDTYDTILATQCLVSALGLPNDV